MAYTKYSLTPANNNAAPPDGAPEGMLPSAVNDTMRDMMAQIRDCGDGIRGGTYTMTAPVITGGSINGTTTITTSGAISYTGTLTGGTGVVNLGSGQFYKDASGNVGIGTSSPSFLLHLSQNGNTTAFISATNAGTNSAGLTLENAGQRNWNIWADRATDTFRIGNNTRATTNITLDSSGNVGIGTTSPLGRLALGAVVSNQVLAMYDDSTNWYGFGISSNNFQMSAATGAAITFNNIARAGGGTLTERMRIDSSGNLLVGRTDNADGSTGGAIYALGSYTQTSSSAANVFITANGLFLRSTSSRKYKTEIQDAEHGLKEVMMLRPVTYRGTGIADTGQKYGGLIAEELDEVGLSEFVQYAEDGTPDALHYGHMVSLAFKAIQELKAIVDTQAARIAALESK